MGILRKKKEKELVDFSLIIFMGSQATGRRKINSKIEYNIYKVGNG